ncbi:MAG: hypothetical protein HY544_00430 [Candidatus Diapherotrites archaeon]|uniref:Uncharacterized protein n=1 Tax=Candidatus Iainarchaeum sp. TaxID=3101447 RepID=A0A8T3YLL6_9ARCH|nr:hypothetical protein [Candidatus Diapherotrites archaeon]
MKKKLITAAVILLVLTMPAAHAALGKQHFPKENKQKSFLDWLWSRIRGQGASNPQQPAIASNNQQQPAIIRPAPQAQQGRENNSQKQAETGQQPMQNAEQHTATEGQRAMPEPNSTNAEKTGRNEQGNAEKIAEKVERAEKRIERIEKSIDVLRKIRLA